MSDRRSPGAMDVRAGGGRRQRDPRRRRGCRGRLALLKGTVMDATSRMNNVDATAETLMRRIVDRVPDWEERAWAGAMWYAAAPEPESWWVAIEPTPVPEDRPRDARDGVVVVAERWGIQIRVTLPGMADSADLRRVLAVLVAAGVLPDEHGGTH